MVYHNGILLTLTNGRNFVIYNNMDKRGGTYAK
jgi:hypothetical protein